MKTKGIVCRSFLWYNLSMLSVALWILKLIAKILTKILTFAIVNLYLWIPLLVTVLYFAGSIALNYSYQNYMPYFSIMVSCAFAASIVLTFYRYFIKKTGPKKSKKKPAVLPRQDDEVIPNIVHLRPAQMPARAKSPAKAPPPPPVPQPVQRVFLDQRYYQNPGARYNDIPKKEEPADLEDFPKSFFEQKSEPLEQPAQKPQPMPKLYRTRKDPTLFIAKFDDKIEYYRKIASGDYILVSVEENPDIA